MVPLVSAVTVTFAVGMNLYQMLCVVGSCPKVHVPGGTGSPGSVVAALLSLVSVKGDGLALMAPAKLSFSGGVAPVIGKLSGIELPPAGGDVNAVTLASQPNAISVESTVMAREV